MAVPITTTLAALLAIWLIVLSIRVIQGRSGDGPSMGDGGDPTVQRRIRAQGNLVEYAPFYLILSGLVEVQGGNPWVLGLLGLVFFVGRIGHGVAFGFMDHFMLGRVAGTLATFVALLALALYALGLVLV